MPEGAEALRLRVEQALVEGAGADVEVCQVSPMFGGACQEHLRLDVRPRGDGESEPVRLVLRADSPASLPGSINRRAEFEVARRAAEAGVHTPAPRWLVQGAVRDGAWSYCMEYVGGHAIGRTVVSDPRLEQARAGLPEVLAANLARIHSITPNNAPAIELPDLERIRAEGPAAQAVRFAREMMDGLPETHLALHLALSWLDKHQPTDREVTLVHGDFRTGNFLVRPDGLAAILDWEFAHWGSPFDDLAWLTVRDWRFGKLALPIGGFARRAALYEPYERLSGRRVDPETVHWWEVLGNVRWAAAAAHQGQRYLSGEVPDFELVAIGRRAAEMEWEALRLIELGPAWALGAGEA